MYTHLERRLAVACVRRYGIRPAGRLLREAWTRAPAQSSLQLWEARADCAPAPAEEEFWPQFEERWQQRLEAEMAVRFEPLLEAMDSMIEQRDAKGFRDSAVALGVLYDKIVPPIRPLGSNENLTG